MATLRDQMIAALDQFFTTHRTRIDETTEASIKFTLYSNEDTRMLTVRIEERFDRDDLYGQEHELSANNEEDGG